MAVETLAKDVLVGINKEIPFKAADGIAGGGDANLDFIVYRVARTRGVNRKAAVLMKSVIEAHPFQDGNKRTAFVAAKTLLDLNGKQWDKVHEYTKEEFTLAAARSDVPVSKMAEWFANHTRRTP